MNLRDLKTQTVARPYMAIELRPVTDSSNQLYTASPTQWVSNVLASLPIQDPPEKGKDAPQTDTWGTPFLVICLQALKLIASNQCTSESIPFLPLLFSTLPALENITDLGDGGWLSFYSRLWKPASVCFHGAVGVSLCISPNLRWFLIQTDARRADCTPCQHYS